MVDKEGIYFGLLLILSSILIVSLPYLTGVSDYFLTGFPYSFDDKEGFVLTIMGVCGVFIFISLSYFIDYFTCKNSD